MVGVIGVPATVLACFLYAARKLALWAGPMVADLVESHKRFLASLTETQHEIRDDTRAIGTTLRESRDELRGIRGEVHSLPCRADARPRMSGT